MPNYQQIRMNSVSFGRTMRGTSDIDVIYPTIGANDGNLGTARPLDLAEFTLTREANGTVKMTLLAQGNQVTLSGYELTRDMVRTTDGSFTLQEILDHGNNLPFVKQAQANARAQRN